MSDLLADVAERLNLREQIARIDRALDEAAKFRSERVKLDAERAQLDAEQAKLVAEAGKLSRDRLLAPGLVLAATLGAIATLVPVILRAFADSFRLRAWVRCETRFRPSVRFTDSGSESSH